MYIFWFLSGWEPTLGNRDLTPDSPIPVLKQIHDLNLKDLSRNCTQSTVFESISQDGVQEMHTIKSNQVGLLQEKGHPQKKLSESSKSQDQTSLHKSQCSLNEVLPGKHVKVKQKGTGNGERQDKHHFYDTRFTHKKLAEGLCGVSRQERQQSYDTWLLYKKPPTGFRAGKSSGQKRSHYTCCACKFFPESHRL